MYCHANEQYVDIFLGGGGGVSTVCTSRKSG
jgi:hypothetical protein